MEYCTRRTLLGQQYILYHYYSCIVSCLGSWRLCSLTNSRLLSWYRCLFIVQSSFILHNVTWRQHSIAATEQHGNAGKKQWVGMCFLLVGRLLSFKMQLLHCHYQSAFRHVPRILLQPALCTIVTYIFFLGVLFCQVELNVCHWLESQQQCTHTSSLDFD